MESAPLLKEIRVVQLHGCHRSSTKITRIMPSVMVSIAITWLCNCIEHKSLRGSERDTAMGLLHGKCALIIEVCCWLVRAQGCHLTSQHIFCQGDEKTRNTHRQRGVITPPPSSSRQSVKHRAEVGNQVLFTDS